jgi:hypothetical protein
MHIQRAAGIEVAGALDRGQAGSDGSGKVVHCIGAGGARGVTEHILPATADFINPSMARSGAASPSRAAATTAARPSRPARTRPNSTTRSTANADGPDARRKPTFSTVFSVSTLWPVQGGDVGQQPDLVTTWGGMRGTAPSARANRFCPLRAGSALVSNLHLDYVHRYI